MASIQIAQYNVRRIRQTPRWNRQTLFPQTRTIIPGSTVPRPASTRIGAPLAAETLTASILLRRPDEHSIAASPADIEAVTNFTQEVGLSIIEVSPPRRTIRVQGTVAAFNTAFGTTLHAESTGSAAPYVTYDGPLTIPANLDGIVVAVLGLDQRPIASPRSNE